jgi:hypothetical protein
MAFVVAKRQNVKPFTEANNLIGYTGVQKFGHLATICNAQIKDSQQMVFFHKVFFFVGR